MLTGSATVLFVFILFTRMKGTSTNEVIYLETPFKVIVELLLFITFESVSLLKQ